MFNYKTEYKNRSRKNRVSIGISIFLIMIFISLTGNQVIAQFKTGEQVADFTLTGLDGESYQLSQFRNKFDYILLCFVEGTNSTAMNNIQDLISFMKDFNPKETYQIITVIAGPQEDQYQNDCIVLQEKSEIPLLFLCDGEVQVTKSFEIEKFPTIVLLRYDLGVRRVFSGFTTRVEKSFYQYLTFTFTSQKSSSTGGCDGGVCPPPE